MKLSRSAIILAIAIILLLIALFTMRSSDEETMPTGNETNATLFNATNATMLASNATNATMPLSNATNATIAADNATIEESGNATAAAEIAQKEKEAEEKAAKEKALKAEKEKAEKEKAAKEKAAKEKAAKEKAAKEKAAKEKALEAEINKDIVDREMPEAATKPPKVTPPANSAISSSDPVVTKLNDFGARRITLLNASIRPSKSDREVLKEGDQYVSRYYYIVPSSLRTEATPADKSSPFQYIGKVRYTECLYEHRAATREEAMSGEGQVIQQRNMCELIQYKNNKWIE